MALYVEIFTVLHRGRRANLSVAKITQEKGAKSSLERFTKALEGLMAKRGMLVEGDERREGMKALVK